MFSELSERERNEEEQVTREQGFGSEFKKDRFNLFNVLTYDTIKKTLVDEETCPVTKELVSLWICIGCPILECPKEEYCYSIKLRE